MADKQSLIQKLNPRLRNPVLKVESIVAFRECCLSDSWASAWDRGGRGTLGAWRGFAASCTPPLGAFGCRGGLKGEHKDPTWWSTKMEEAVRIAPVHLNTVFSSEPLWRGPGINPPSCRG